MSIANDEHMSFWSGPEFKSRRSFDLLCRHFEDLWHTQQRISVESLLTQSDASIRDELTRELVAIEWELRLEHGEAPKRADYLGRFPSVADLMDELEALPTEKLASDSTERTVTQALEPGSLFCGHRIVRELGRGAMGIVYLAEVPTIGHQVALKILKSGHARDPLVATRFEREARLLSQLDHPGIVPLYSYGEDKGLRYLVMKAIRGVSLAEVLFGHDPAGPAVDLLRNIEAPQRLERIRAIAIELTEALQFVHQASILHRDIKPSNVLLADSGKVFLFDFSLARTNLIDSDLTSQHEFIGTLRYAAPECLDGIWTVQTDLYSLGLVLLELCTLQPSFEARTRRELLQKRLDSTALREAAQSSSVPIPLRRIIEKLTQFRPEDRYASAADVLVDLRNANINGASKHHWPGSRLVVTSLICFAVILLAIFWNTRSGNRTDSDGSADPSVVQSGPSEKNVSPAEPVAPVTRSAMVIAETNVVPLSLPGRANVLTISDDGETVVLSAAGHVFRWDTGTSQAVEVQHRKNGRIITADISPDNDIVFSAEESSDGDPTSVPNASKSYGMASNMPEEGNVWGGFHIPDFDSQFCSGKFVRGGPATPRATVIVPSATSPAILELPSHKVTGLPWHGRQLRFATAWESSLAVITTNDRLMLTTLKEPDIHVAAIPTEVPNPTAAEFLNDGRTLIVCNEDEFRLFSVTTQQMIATQKIPGGTRPVLSTPHQGPWIAFSGQRIVRVFDMAYNTWLPEAVETSHNILLAVPIATEHLVVTVEEDGRIRLTDMQPNRPRIVDELATTPLTLSAYSVPSQRIAVIDAENNLRIFKIDEQQ